MNGEHVDLSNGVFSFTNLDRSLIDLDLDLFFEIVLGFRTKLRIEEEGVWRRSMCI